MSRISSGVGGALLLLSQLPEARAQSALVSVDRADQLEEVVVTATRRTESLQKVPISISTFGEADMEARGVKNFEDLIRLPINCLAHEPIPALRD